MTKLNFISITIQSKKIIYKSLQYYRLHQQNTSNFAANSLNKIKFFDRFKLIFKVKFKLFENFTTEKTNFSYKHNYAKTYEL